MILRDILLALGLSMTLAACLAEPTARADAGQPTAPLTAEQWRALSGRKILFGHQSVGRNILDGVRRLAHESEGPTLNISTEASAFSGQAPGLLEFTVGENGDPASKAADFARMVDRVGRGDGVIAIYKHCYLDVARNTDPAAMFEAYAAGVRELSRRHPGLTIVHATVPLTTIESAPARLLRGLFGRTTRLELNAKRNEFNRQLRRTYAGREPIFDLARVESTRSDGSRSFAVIGRDTVFNLAPDWTADGGHLNEAGSRRAATELLSVLAGL